MATLILSAAGSAVGNAFGGPVGSFIGGVVGRAIGGYADNAIFGSGGRNIEGARLSDLAVQTSTYGKTIPIIYGTVRIAGNVIWSQPIKEMAITTSAGGGKGGGGRSETTATTYSYSVTLVISICEGEITEILRVWADSKQLNLAQGTYRIYKGTETQNPDSLIESIQGVGKTPAYRGQAYVVIEDFPLGDFGNRIPNFTFEVRRKLLHVDYQGEAVEQMVKSVVLIPGSGEFVYDTTPQYKVGGELVDSNWVQQGERTRINVHTSTGDANVKLALDQMEETFPNLEWVALVVTWFGDSLDAGACVIKPGVEYQTGAITEPETWSVGSFTRSTARQITIVDGKPRYGGTPDDQSIIRLLDELADRGLSVMFYPMFFMDVADKPWRGRVTGTASDVSSFFTKTNGYNAFINHYASLVAGKVQAFVIGSELIGLTKVTDVPANYPAVNQLVSLAATVKSTLGSGVTVTYAADWSEYHHTDGGWYNLDPLWASPNIDVVGIDSYFPLSDEVQSGYDIQKVIDGWTSGEGYDWYYTDPARTTQAALTPQYAWKNIAWWWNNSHTNPDASTTAWVPASKPIWFTEFGFPSVDGAINQPNVFYDPLSLDGAFPRFSKGKMDIMAQRQGIAGTEAKWKGSTMIPRRFLWTWDARPYPYWPDRNDVWADGDLWKYGHWVTGKFGLSSLATVVRDLCLRAGLEDADIDVSELKGLLEGYVINNQPSARSAIETLADAFFFDSFESEYKLKFINFKSDVNADIDIDEIVANRNENGSAAFTISRQQEIEIPTRIDVNYFNKTTAYQTGTQSSILSSVDGIRTNTISLPIVMAEQQAKDIAEVTLKSLWIKRNIYSFDLPIKYSYLEPSNIVNIIDGSVTHKVKIIEAALGNPHIIKCRGYAEDSSVYETSSPPAIVAPIAPVAEIHIATSLEVLDLPAFPNDNVSGAIRYAAYNRDGAWKGAVLYRSDDGGANYAKIADMPNRAIFGTAIEALPNFNGNITDVKSEITIVLLNGELEGISREALLNGGNLCKIGNEILQFQSVEFIEDNKYIIRNLLRGRLGTEWAISTHSQGERFILLDSRLARGELNSALIGLQRNYKPATIGATLGQTAAQSYTVTGKFYKPYSPVHIKGARDGSGNLTISWIRRTRQGGEWRDYVDAGLSESTEQYEVEIMNGSNVVRTISGITSATTTYTAAQQTTDFGSPQASVSVKIYQLSTVIGRGDVAIANV